MIFTSAPQTLAALRRAGDLASRLDARITLLVPQVVPFPCPLASPPVLVEFSERRLRLLAEASPVETTVKLYLCRDRWTALVELLKPRSLVVIAGRRREKRLAQRLSRAGHEVVFAETE